MDATQITAVDPGAQSVRTLLCPGCGYDLRGAAGERCSECGLAVDRTALTRSGFPWAHRKGVGRLRAFLKTVWLVTWDAKALRYETAKSQSVRDALAFRRWVAVALATGFAGAVLMLLLGNGIKELVVLREPSPFTIVALEGIEADLWLPWSAGIVSPVAPFVYTLLLAAYLADAPRRIFRNKGMSADYGETVEAIGAYVAAPLAWLLPATAGYVTLIWLAAKTELVRTVPPIEAALIGINSLLVLLAIGGTVYRTGQWRARTIHRGYAAGFLAMGELLVRLAIGFVACLAVVPWCVGFVWLVVDSFLG